MRFPAIMESDLEADRATVLRIGFRCRVLRYGTTFTGWAGHTESGVTGQKILAGNAADLGPEDATFPPTGTVDARVLSVDVPLAGNDVLIDTEAAPRPFSPNGDGINDQVHISYNLSRVIKPVPVEVKVFNLGGHLVRRLFTGAQGGGHWSIPWDGTNGSGELLPPGIYLAHVDVHSAVGAAKTATVVELAY